MKKILVGVKHREALENIRFMNYFQEKNNWSIEFSLVPFFKLTNKEIEVISEEGIKFISVDWGIPFIKGDGKKTNLEKDNFDIVFVSATIEHVGSYNDQINFLKECSRISKN